VPVRRYDQFCGLARALELVGERWTLLVVRELLDGPKRYGELAQVLAPIATDVLAGRLRELEAAGLVTREAGRTYVLTADGAALAPTLDALARWGLRRLERRPADVVNPRWLGLAVRALLRTDRPGVDIVVRLEVPEGSATLHITEATVTDITDADDGPDSGTGGPDCGTGGPDGSTGGGAGRRPDVVLAGEAEVLAAALDPARRTALVASGELTVTGDADAVRSLAALFRGDER